MTYCDKSILLPECENKECKKCYTTSKLNEENMEREIRRGIDCACDEENICRYHLRKCWQWGIFFGITIPVLIISLMFYLSY